jgi:glycosyltransferase involved in cell wall biosynthesis
VRILHLTDRLTARGGAHRHLAGVLESLSAQGHELHIAAGVLSPWPKPHDRPDPGAIEHLLPGLDARDAAAIDLGPLLGRVHPDVIHVHTVVNPAALEQAASAGAMITVQDHRYFCPGRGKWTLGGEVCRDALSPAVCASCFEERAYFDDVLALTTRRLEALRRMRAVVVLSEYMKKEMVAAGLAASRVHVIPPFVYGLDLDAGPDGPPCVLFVGRLVEHKGVRDAVEAWRRSQVGLPLVVAGTGPRRDEMEAAGAEVLGWLDPPGLSRAYARARALLLPSRWQEPFGIAGLEAATMGIPVVAWESGGISEWHRGPRVSWGDVDALAAALREAVNDRATPPRVPSREEAMARLTAIYRDFSG